MTQPIAHRHAEHPAAAVPLGGIGTGTVALGADGSLRQWQLHNVGTHHGDLPGSFFALRVQQHVPPFERTMALLAPPVDPPATPMVDDGVMPTWQRDLADRHPGVVGATLSSTYPVAALDYDLGDAPVTVRLEATSPMSPTDADLSGIPTVLFEFTVTNRTDVPTRVWLGAAWHNAVGLDPRVNPRGVRSAGYGGNVNRLSRGRGWAHLVLDNVALDPLSAAAGQQVLSIDGEGDAVGAFAQFEHPDEFVDHLRTLAPWGDGSVLRTAPHAHQARSSAPRERFGPSATGHTWLGGLTSVRHLEAHESATIRVALSWCFPNRQVDFVQFGPERPEWGATRFWLGNHYAQAWPDAVSVARAVETQWGPWWAATRAWANVLDRMPGGAVERQHLAAQAVVPRSATCFRTADGAFFGFEGVLGASTPMWSGNVGGSCPLNCTHVWNYAQAAAALFPSLERSMRETELDVMVSPTGVLPHRVIAPTYLRQLWDEPIGGPVEPALDGMLGAVLKTLREVRRGAVDRDWLEPRWASLAGIMSHVERTWDPDGEGLLRGIQPSTHDIHLHGPNPYTGTLWLAALRAGEDLAHWLGDDERAAAWRARFEHSSARHDSELFDGGYYVQQPETWRGAAKQWGDGCLSDQLIGQWWAHQLGLGHLLPREHVVTTLRQIVEHNLRDDLDVIGPGQRRFAVGGERGLVVATWPRGGRPDDPLEYCDEVWTGVEYQVAAHCLYEGLVDEGERILAAIWHRHDGRRRSPWNEVECGDHYVRSMAGWSVLEARSGLSWDHRTGLLEVRRPVAGVLPVLTGTGWGELEIDPRADGDGAPGIRAVLTGRAGEVPVHGIRLGDGDVQAVAPVGAGESVAVRG